MEELLCVTLKTYKKIKFKFKTFFSAKQSKCQRSATSENVFSIDIYIYICIIIITVFIVSIYPGLDQKSADRIISMLTHYPKTTELE